MASFPSAEPGPVHEAEGTGAASPASAGRAAGNKASLPGRRLASPSSLMSLSRKRRAGGVSPLSGREDRGLPPGGGGGSRGGPPPPLAPESDFWDRH
jgi:hypothetical protein